jgi:aryl-alcohol dehydrogenase-like predicted oxidoreductase
LCAHHFELNAWGFNERVYGGKGDKKGRVVMQVQYSLLDRRPENGMTEFCDSANVKLLPFGTVAGGFLSEKYVGFPPEKCASLLVHHAQG